MGMFPSWVILMTHNFKIIILFQGDRKLLSNVFRWFTIFWTRSPQRAANNDTIQIVLTKLMIMEVINPRTPNLSVALVLDHGPDVTSLITFVQDLVMIHVPYHPICHLDIHHDSIPIIIIFIKNKVKEFFIIHASHHSNIMANRETKINNNMAKIIMAVSNRQIMLQVSSMFVWLTKYDSLCVMYCLL